MTTPKPAEIPPDLLKAIGAHQRAFESGDVADYDTAIAAWERALVHPRIAGTPHLQRMAWNQIGSAMLARYESSGSEEHLRRAVEFAWRALQGEPEDSAMISMFLATFARALRMRYVLHREEPDLSTATEAMRLSLSRQPRSRDDAARGFTELSVLRRLRYEANEDLEALDQAVGFGTQAVSLAGPRSDDRAAALTVLGNALYIRSRQRPEDQQEALKAYEEALELAPSAAARSDRLSLSINIASLLASRFTDSGNRLDLERAIEYLRAVAASPGLADARRPALMMKLAEALRMMSDLTGDRRELDEFVAGPFADTLEDTLSGSPYRRRATTELAWALLEHYDEHAAADDLDRGITLLRDTSVGLASDSAARRIFPALAAMLRVRYERHGRLDDLDDAIDLLGKAAEQASSVRSCAQILYHLAIAFQRRYEETREQADLRAMLAAINRAVDDTPVEDPNRPAMLMILGQGLNAIHTGTGDSDALERALRYWREAIGLVPPRSREFCAGLNSLAAGLISRFEMTGDASDLDEAIGALREVFALTSRESPHLPGFLHNLANGLYARYQVNGSESDRDEAFTIIRMALALPQLSGPTLLRMARTWGRRAARHRAWNDAAEISVAGLAAAAELFQTQVGREHKEIWLGDANGLAAEAAYALAKVGRYLEALTALERGQAQLLSEAMERDEADLDQVAALGHAELSTRFRETARRITNLERAALVTSPGPIDEEPPVARLRGARAKLAEITAQIRRLPGMDGFLRQLAPEEIIAESEPCPLVYLSSTWVGGLALIAHRDGQVTPLWLDGLSEQPLNAVLTAYFGAYARLSEGTDEWLSALDRLTAWLWPSVMEPLLAALAGHDHVIIVPTGPLALLPLHAAWTADASAPSGRRYALDHLLLTSSPNARVLRLARRRAALTPATRVLAVANPAPSKRQPLRFAESEARAATAGYPDSCLFVGSAATGHAVRTELPRASALHFACHGAVDRARPLDSGIVLVGDELLRVRDFMALELPGIRIAVLSACDTGVIGTALPDEFVGLPAGLLQAGVAGVISTLWSIDDESAALLMARYYQLCAAETDMSYPQALRAAQAWLRDRAAGKYEHPAFWAAFTYTGA